MQTIDSIKHEKVILARSLHSAKERHELRRCLVEGREQLQWVLDSSSRLECAFVHDKALGDPFVAILKEKRVPLFVVSEGILKKIAERNYLVPFLGIAHFPNPPGELACDMVVLLDGVKDLGNLGTIIRTGKAFGIDQFFSTDPKGDCFYQKTIDASRGTVFSTHFYNYSSPIEAVEALKERGYQVVVTTPHQSKMQSLAALQDKPIAVVFGNETHGACQEIIDRADLKVFIPMSPAVESLNVGVAAGISLYELKIKLVLAMLNQKIQASYGRNLTCTARWVRAVFDHLLKQGTPLNADSAIVLMMLKCEGTGKREQLVGDAGADAVPFDRLIKEGYLLEEKGSLRLTEHGEELIAKIWAIHETAEELALKGFSGQERKQLTELLGRIQVNCSQVVPYS